MVKRQFGIRLTEDLVKRVETERKRRIDEWGVPVSLTAMVEVLVKERLDQTQQPTG